MQIYQPIVDRFVVFIINLVYSLSKVMSSRFQVSLLLGVYLRCYSHGKCINTSGRLAVPLTLSAEGQIQLRLAQIGFLCYPVLHHQSGNSGYQLKTVQEVILILQPLFLQVQVTKKLSIVSLGRKRRLLDFFRFVKTFHLSSKMLLQFIKKKKRKEMMYSPAYLIFQVGLYPLKVVLRVVDLFLITHHETMTIM